MGLQATAFFSGMEAARHSGSPVLSICSSYSTETGSSSGDKTKWTTSIHSQLQEVKMQAANSLFLCWKYTISTQLMCFAKVSVSGMGAKYETKRKSLANRHDIPGVVRSSFGSFQEFSTWWVTPLLGPKPNAHCLELLHTLFLHWPPRTQSRCGLNMSGNCQSNWQVDVWIPANKLVRRQDFLSNESHWSNHWSCLLFHEEFALQLTGTFFPRRGSGSAIRHTPMGNRYSAWESTQNKSFHYN